MPRGWKRGDLLAWDELCAGVRRDLYDLGHHVYEAHELYSPVPDCTCSKVVVDFEVRSPTGATGPGSIVVSSSDTTAKLGRASELRPASSSSGQHFNSGILATPPVLPGGTRQLGPLARGLRRRRRPIPRRRPRWAATTRARADQTGSTRNVAEFHPRKRRGRLSSARSLASPLTLRNYLFGISKRVDRQGAKTSTSTAIPHVPPVPDSAPVLLSEASSRQVDPGYRIDPEAKRNRDSMLETHPQSPVAL